MTISKSSLEAWIAGQLGSSPECLTREQLNRYQLHKLRETIAWVYQHSVFYRKKLTGVADGKLRSITEFQQYPCTTAAELKEQGAKLLCVSQSDISRVVTLESSGTTGPAKRIYFTPGDQQLTLDFFAQGMSALVEPGDKVLILLPGERAGGVGQLLATALENLGAKPVLHGVVASLASTLTIMIREKIQCIVGIPVQVLALARYAKLFGPNLSLKSVLLSTDHVPGAISQELQQVWGCQVFEHYGMTEMGLGGGLDCEAHAGYHVREADLFLEIVDEDGLPVPDGQTGEVVFTTLTRQGMPLIRYRTGDISRFLPEPCPCGTILKRLERITRRKTGLVFLKNNSCFTMADLDEVLFTVAGVRDFTVEVDDVKRAANLAIRVWTLSPDSSTEGVLVEAVNKVPVLKQAQEQKLLAIRFKIDRCTGALLAKPGKRTIGEMC